MHMGMKQEWGASPCGIQKCRDRHRRKNPANNRSIVKALVGFQRVRSERRCTSLVEAQNSMDTFSPREKQRADQYRACANASSRRDVPECRVERKKNVVGLGVAEQARVTTLHVHQRRSTALGRGPIG